MEIKIAFTHFAYPHGGAEKITADLARYLVPKGYKIYIFVEELQENLVGEYERQNITFIPTSFGCRSRDGMAACARFIGEKTADEGIDILVIPEGWYINTEFVRQNTRSKIIFSLHSLPLWEIVDFFIRGRHDALTSGSAGKFLEWYFLRLPHELLTGRRRRKITEGLKRNYLNTDAYTVICEPYKQRMLEVIGPEVATAGDNHIEVIPNFIPQHDYDHAVKKKRVLFIGRLKYSDKRVDRLLDIWAEVYRDFPDWELCIVGDGNEKKRLIRKSRKLRLTGVEFHDYTPYPDEYYRTASIICLTSNYEGWPLVLAEGQQAGAVPMAFDVSAGIREQLAPSGVNGILVEPFDEHEYARGLARLMGDEALREEMRRNVVAKSKEYSNESRLARWEELVKGLLKK